MTKTQVFIEKNKKKLTSGADFFNPDTSLMPVEKFYSSKCRMLLILPSPHTVKTVSSTAAAINDFVIEHCKDTFVDFAYMPEKEDIKKYDDANVPYAIGTITHLDASHFDIVGFSISVLSEVVTTPVILKSFDRCDSPIPLFWSTRKDMKFGTTPLVYCGGITAVCGDVMFGEVPGKGTSFLDFVYLGECGKLDVLTQRFIQAKEIGAVTRSQSDHDVPGYPHVDIPDLQEIVKVETTQDFIESLFDLNMIYQPQAYKVVYNKYHRIIENTKINPKARDFVKPYYPHILAEDLGIGRTIINGNGDGTGTAQTQVSEGCSAAGACSFCSEGNYTGGWVEKTPERILWEARECKKYSAGYKYKPYSFNANYIKDYKGQLVKFRKMYPKVTFINMRLEELGRDTDALKMMKRIGSNRISAPIEGLSPRVQNNLLNKCLSEESLTNFMDDMVHMKMTDIKVGAIFTAYEEEQDFQWICDFVDRFKGRASREGGNFPFRLKATPLVHYPLTPIEYIERKSARKSFEGEHWLTDEWYEKFREHEVFFKVNGFRFSTFLEQSFVDMGRRITPLIYKHFIFNETPVYSLRSCATDEFLKELMKFVNPYITFELTGYKDNFVPSLHNLSAEDKAESDKYMEGYFGDRDPEHYISPCHRIHIDLMGSYIPRARRLVHAKKSGNIFSNEPDIRCLKTYEGAPVKCYHTCIKESPLKIYQDVTLDAEGNLNGDFRLLYGCERCQSAEQRKDRLARNTDQTANDEILAGTPLIPEVQKIRFVLNRLPEYDVLNPNNTAHTFITKFLQKSDTLLDAYHSISNHNLFWQSDAANNPNIKYFTSGIQIVDTVWSKNVLAEVQGLIEEVNKELKTVKILSASDIYREDKIKITDINVFTFESTLPLSSWDSARYNYKGKMRLYGGMGTAEIREDAELEAPMFFSKGKVMGVFAIPAAYNPSEYLSGYLNVSAEKVAETTTMSCVMVMREGTQVCKKCAKERALFSLRDNKAFPFGKTCLCSALITKMKN